MAMVAALAAAAMAQQTGAVRQIAITGNGHVSQAAILAAMRSKVGQPLDQSLLDQDKHTLEDMGFFQAVDVRAKPAEPDGWQINVDVKEWAVIKEIRVVGNTVVPTKAILEVLDLKSGQIYNFRSATASAKAIKELYTKDGYYAEVGELGPLKDYPDVLNVKIIEAVVGDVKAIGNTRTKDRVMKRLIKTRPGDIYSEKKWGNDLRRIFETHWFEGVPKDKEEPDANLKLNLSVEVKEARTAEFGGGVQVDPQSSFAGFVNYKDLNFHGSGQSLGLNFLQATTGGGPSVTFDYANPFWDAHDTAFNLSVYSRLVYRFSGAGFGSSSTPTNDNRYFERRNGTTFGFTHPVSDYVSQSIGVRYEGIKTGNLNTTTNTGFIQQDGQVGVLSLGLINNRRDVDPEKTGIDPSRGNWMKVSVEPGYSKITEVAGDQADRSLLGSNTFVRTNLEVRAYASPGQKPRGKDFEATRRVVALRARYGYISGKVPFFEQFFAGGTDSVRGYPDDRFWGKQMFLSTLEYRHPFQKAFSVIGFMDYGGAWGGYGDVNSYTQSSTAKFNLGYGAGISVQTPLGRIRVDVGFNSEGKSRTHFLIGTSF